MSNIEFALSRMAIAIIIAAMGMFASVYLLPVSFFSGAGSYAPLHVILETFAVVVAALIFSIGWHSHAQQKSLVTLYIACIFLSTAILDLVHLLSYAGMPDFITPNNTHKAILFWFAARAIVAVGLLLILGNNFIRVKREISASYILSLTLIIIISLIWALFIFETDLPAMFIPGEGLTTFKVKFEYLLIMTYLFCAFGFLMHSEAQADRFKFRQLGYAAVIMAMSEMCFTLYVAVSDTFNVLGHIYKVIAYGIIYRAIIVINIKRPYQMLAASEQELRDLNKDLEEKVLYRTKSLKEANEELESFSYSVSHDLRAPLRGIEGFSTLLSEKYSEQLDDTGRDYISRIRKACLSMSELIDDMLALSRVGRASISLVSVDMSELASEILNKKREQEPDRNVKVEIEDGLVVRADRQLIKIALDNLLGNAWKFTRNKEHANIIFKKDNTDNRFIISDNGAGFNINSANMLFSPFHRLHSKNEFEGTGIGLAIVHRVIKQHNGKIWADAEEGKGANFYFSLGKEEHMIS